MRYELFVKLYEEALDYKDVDMYISERGWQSWMDEFGSDDDTSVIVFILKNIFDLAKSTLREIRENKKMNRVNFSDRYKIPNRTVQNWEYGNSTLAEYDALLIAYTFFMDAFLDFKSV